VNEAQSNIMSRTTSSLWSEHFTNEEVEAQRHSGWVRFPDSRVAPTEARLEGKVHARGRHHRLSVALRRGLHPAGAPHPPELCLWAAERLAALLHDACLAMCCRT